MASAESPRSPKSPRSPRSSEPTFKEVVHELWSKVPSSDRTHAKAVEICIDSYEQTSVLIEDTYIGHAKIEGGPGETVLDQVTASILENHAAYKALQGFPLSNDYVDRVFCPEYATNLVWRNGRLELVSIKYIGTDLLPGQMAAMDIVVTKGFPIIDDYFMEFVWNVLRLKLRGPAALQDFVEMNCDPRFYCYLLDDEDVQKLAKEGTHERFADDDIADTLALLRDITASAKVMFNMAG